MNYEKLLDRPIDKMSDEKLRRVALLYQTDKSELGKAVYARICEEQERRAYST